MNEEEQQYMNNLEMAYEMEKRKSFDLGTAQSTMFNSPENSNLIQWQLELDNILERAEHLLRGDELKFDDKGQLKWEKTEDMTKRIFNDYGVQEILRVLSMYLNRNTILSNYDEKTINWKIYDLGIELTDLVYMKYEVMGLDTPEKIKLYMILVRQIVDATHSSYLRALNGGERESLRTARMVTQNQPLGQNGMMGYPQPQSKFSLIRPSTWFHA